MSRLLMEKVADTRWKKEVRNKPDNTNMYRAAMLSKTLGESGRKRISEAGSQFSSSLARAKSRANEADKWKNSMKYGPSVAEIIRAKQKAGIGPADKYTSGRNQKDAERRNSLIRATGIGERYEDGKTRSE